MGKEALADLSRRLQGNSKQFRNSVINKQIHMVDTKETSISKQLKDEIKASDPDLLKHITDRDIGVAASKFRATLMGLAGNSKFTSLSILETDKNVIVSNTYGTLAAALAKASEAALAYIRTVLTKNSSDYVLSINSKFIQLDHTRTVAESRITSDIHASGINPISLIQELKSQKFITRKDLLDVYENILEISSYYSGDSKVFSIQGKVVSGALIASTTNEAEGRKLINERTANFRKAVKKAIESNNWLDQAASDSYREYLFKKIGLAVKEAGGISSFAKPVDKTPAKANSVEKIVEKVIANEYSAVGGIKSTKSKVPTTARPMINISMINDYINERLPETIRSNMNKGGTLRNRTGRFSNSAHIVGAEVTEQEFPTLLYTYQRSPYDVFDAALGKKPWNTPGRDPKELIEKSIREIAKDLAIGRFYVRRA